MPKCASVSKLAVLALAIAAGSGFLAGGPARQPVNSESPGRPLLARALGFSASALAAGLTDTFGPVDGLGLFELRARARSRRRADEHVRLGSQVERHRSRTPVRRGLVSGRLLHASRSNRPWGRDR